MHIKRVSTVIFSDSSFKKYHKGKIYYFDSGERVHHDQVTDKITCLNLLDKKLNDQKKIDLMIKTVENYGVTA